MSSYQTKKFQLNTAPELVQQAIQPTEVQPKRARRLQGDQVEEPVDADLPHGPRRQTPDEGQVHRHVCIMIKLAN